MAKKIFEERNSLTFLKTLPIEMDEDKIIMGKLSGYNLAAPISFWENQSLHYDLVGGCGPGGVGDYFVPDTIWFLKITAACMIHDWCFLVWNTKEGFKLANDLFKNNIMRINDQTDAYTWVKNLRRERGWKYYMAVHKFGESSYYDSHKKIIDDATD